MSRPGIDDVLRCSSVRFSLPASSSTGVGRRLGPQLLSWQVSLCC